MLYESIEHRAKAVTPSANSYPGGPIPNYSLGFLCDPDVLYDLENARENELLASVDLEDIINNSGTYLLCESEVSDEGGYENNEQSGNINKKRFKNMSNAAIDDIITRAETTKTKESTKWARRRPRKKCGLFVKISRKND